MVLFRPARLDKGFQFKHGFYGSGLYFRTIRTDKAGNKFMKIALMESSISENLCNHLFERNERRKFVTKIFPYLFKKSQDISNVGISKIDQEV
jgi:hypothetical protein